VAGSYFVPTWTDEAVGDEAEALWHRDAEEIDRPVVATGDWRLASNDLDPPP